MPQAQPGRTSPPGPPAYILAGGLSTRFGSDKAIFPVHGQPLALHIAAQLSAAGCQPHIIARHFRPQLAALPHVFEPDYPHHHPLFGIHTALSHAQTPHALITACDHPDLTPTHIHTLLAHIPSRTPQLFAILPTSMAPLALALAQSQAPLREFWANIPLIDIPFLGNMNHADHR